MTWQSLSDRFEGNNAASGSGGAIFVERHRIQLLGNQGSCIGNNAKIGGGCILFEPFAYNSDDDIWDELRPEMSWSMTESLKSNTASYGNGLASFPVFIDVVGEEYTFEVQKYNDGKLNAINGSGLELKLIDKYGAPITRQSMTITSEIYDRRIRSLTLENPRGTENVGSKQNITFNFEGLVVLDSENLGKGPHRLSLEAVLDFPNELSRKLFGLRGDRRTDKGGVAVDVLFRGCNIDNNEVERFNVTQERRVVCQICPKKTIVQIGRNGAPSRCVCDGTSTEEVRNVTRIKQAWFSSDDEKCNDLRSESSAFDCCIECPDGANCNVGGRNGLRGADITAIAGFWSPKPQIGTDRIFLNCSAVYDDWDTARARCCPDNSCGSSVSNLSSTVHANASECARGYTGPLCMACEKDYVRLYKACRKCDGVDNHDQLLEGAIRGLLTINSLCLIVFVVLFMVAKPADKNANDNSKNNLKKSEIECEEDAVSRFVGDQIMVARLSTGTVEGNAGITKSDLGLLMDRVKIIFGWMQIFSAMTVTYEDVPWPEGFGRFSMGLGVFANLDFMGLLDRASCSFALPFLDKFILHMLLPFIVTLFVCLARVPAYFLCRTADKRMAQTELMYKIVVTLGLIMYPVRLCHISVLGVFLLSS